MNRSVTPRALEAAMTESDKRLGRRMLICGVGAVAVTPLSRFLLGCGGTETARSVAADAWATGGTASMTAKASYPDPFASGAPATCAMTCELTEGPCYDAQSEVRADISYGQPGLPMRMLLQLWGESCKPIAGADVDVWHTAPTGKYSGSDSSNMQVAFCTGNDSEYASHLYFRGRQTSDERGIVAFDTCFPGWYASRTIHVHMTITVNGTSYLTTQLVFDDALDDEIVATQPLYDARGKRDTTNTTDTVVSASTYKDHVFSTQKMSDGALLAYKTLILRSSLSTKLCSG
jgi:protocatechuate 3,4-dioxygenase beta subunit